MRYVFVLIFIFILAPSIALAACDAKGYTVVYVNGILTTKEQANLDVNKLQDYLGYNFNSENLVVHTGYNSSHLAGAGDLIESASQLLGSSINNYDLNTILLQIHPEIATRKILLVGHSQGTFYTNELYKYLTENGEPKEAIGVYNVATPASFVAGSLAQPPQYDSGQVTASGAYLTSENDKVINAVRSIASKIKAKQPLPANISIPLTPEEAAASFGGHSFNGVYLANAAARIIPEVEDALTKLVAGEVPETADGGCFIPPPRNIAYYTQKLAFVVADTTATGVVAAKNGIVAVGTIAYNVALAAGQSVVGVAETVYANIGKWFAINPGQNVAVISNSFGDSSQPNSDAVIPDSDSENQSDPAVTTENGFPVIPQASLASEADTFFMVSSVEPSSSTTESKNVEDPERFGGADSQSNNPSSGLIAIGGSAYVSGGGGPSTSSGSSSGGGGAGLVENSSAPIPETSGSTASSTATSSTPLSPANHIVISEVLFDAAGSDVGKEFVELYNPNGSGLDLTGWSLKYEKENSTTTVSLASFKTGSHPEDTTLIPSKGFLLIGLNDYDAANYGGKSADILRTVSLPNGESGGSPQTIAIILSNDSSSEVDRIAYDKNSIANEGQSIERKVIQGGTCVSSQGQAEFLGNNCDTDQDEDFETRTLPTPQNSGSLFEPRNAPVPNNFQIMYDFAPRFDFSWDTSQDAAGATSTLSYSISDTNNSSSTSLLFETSSTASTTFAYAVNEVGHDYDFTFTVQDRDGLSSVATSTVAAKTFLDNLYFYQDTRPSSTAYLFDLTVTSSRPFWNTNDSSQTQSWKAIVFYLNEDAPKENIISTDNSLTPSDSVFVAVRYSICAGGESSKPELLLPLNNYSCQAGGLMSGAYLFNNLKNNRFAVKLSSSTSDISFSPSDYVTLAFYDFGGGGGGSQRLQLTAIDTTKYFFQNSPAVQVAPTTPGNFSVDFDNASERINLAWSASTDADTLEYLIHYEVNYSTSTVFDDSAWDSRSNLLYASTIPVFPNTYKLGVRAVDDFGNASTPSTLNWSFPAGFVLVPSQLNHDDNIGRDGSAQKILTGSAATIGGAGLFVDYSGGPFSKSQSYIEIYEDDNDSIGVLIATSTPNTIDQHDGARERIYNFSPSVLLNASSSYWLVLRKGPSGATNGTRIYGTFSDSYSDGFWSGNPAGRDAYFRLIQQ